MASCPKCSTQAEARFCPECGTQLAAEFAAPPQAQAPLAYQPQAHAAPAYQPQPAPGQFGHVPAEAPLWQGLAALIIGLLTVGLVGGAILAEGIGDEEMILGGLGVSFLAGLLVLPLGGWALFKNRAAGKVMGGTGIAAVVIFFVILLSIY